MARAYSQVYSVIRGSVGGLTYSANQYHQIIVRARTAPVNPSSGLQTAVRAALGYAQAVWSTLSAAVRVQWDAVAATCTYLGPVGNYTTKGQQLFCAVIGLGSYLNSEFGESIVIDGTVPIQNGFGKLSNITLGAPSAAGTGFALGTWNPETYAQSLLVNISPPLPDTRNFWKGPWDGTKTVVVPAAASSSSTRDIVGLVEGSKYFLRIRAIGSDDEHRITPPYLISGTAATTV